MSEPRNGERKLISIVGIIVWRWGMGLGLAVAAYGAMWVKLNAPSREQFDLLTVQVRGLREEMIRGERLKDSLEEVRRNHDKLEERVKELEHSATPRRPPFRPLP